MIPASRPYRDELVSGAVIRCCRHFQISTKQLARTFFGKKSWKVVTLTSSPLQHLAALFEMPAYELLWKHTVFAYSTAYWEPQAFDLALTRTLEGFASATPAKSISPTNIRRHCVRCAKADLAELGESYWRRAHNLPGVVVCADHRCPLTVSPYRLDYALPHELAGTALSKRPIRDVHLEVAARSVQLLCRPFGPGQPKTPAHYRALAVKSGWMLSDRDANEAALRRALACAFGTRFLKSLELQGDWASLLLRPRTDVPFAPLKHVLLETLLSSNPPPLGIIHKSSGPSRSEALVLDELYSSAASRVFAMLSGESLSTEAFLRRSGCFGAYRHRKHELPRLRAIVLRFRHSHFSLKPLGAGKKLFRSKPSERT